MVDICKRMRTMSLDPERLNVKSYGVFITLSIVHVLCFASFSAVINQVLKDTHTKIYICVADRHASNIT